MRIFRIKPAVDKVRVQLCPEDVVVNDVFESAGLVTKYYDGKRLILVFAQPFATPSFKRFYASRIQSSTDPYLLDLCQRILYLNPKPKPLMVKKITEFIILRFSQMVMRPSKIQQDRLMPTPILTFEAVEPVVYAAMQTMTDYTPDNTDVIMFPRGGDMLKGDKISWRASHRRSILQGFMSEAIHQAAEILIEDKEWLKLTHTRIEDSKLVQVKGELAPVRQIRKFMSDRTKRVIDDHNESAPFKSEHTHDNYKKFLELPPGTLDQNAHMLGVSKSTILKFKHIEYENNSI
jgi:hypothetical protein